MKIKTMISLFVVFTSGLIIGIFAGQFILHLRFQHIMQKGPQEIEQYFLRQLTQKLDLRTEQLPAIEQVTKGTAVIMETTRKQTLEHITNTVNNMLKNIRPLLDAKQQAILDTMDESDLRPGPPPLPPRMSPSTDRKDVSEYQRMIHHEKSALRI